MSGDSTIIAAGHAEVLVSQVDLPLFKAFLRHRDKFEALLEGEVFDVAHGKATINYHEGRVQSIQVERRTYQHQAPRAFGQGAQ